MTCRRCWKTTAGLWRHHYGVEKYREQLLSIYERVVQHPVRHRLDKQVLLDTFFDLERFSLLKWGAYEG